MEGIDVEKVNARTRDSIAQYEGQVIATAAKETVERSSQSTETLRGYGLPCSHCRAYYPADLFKCPICGCEERISPDDVPALLAKRTGLGWART
jgi:hypothetical protein